jgi:hypothetical protein
MERSENRFSLQFSWINRSIDYISIYLEKLFSFSYIFFGSLFCHIHIEINLGGILGAE